VWPNYRYTGSIGLDVIIWASLNLVIHALAMYRLFMDERRIKFKKEDEKQMNSFLLRRGGMQPLEVSQVLKKGTWKRYKAGEVMLSRRESIYTAILLVEGKAQYNRYKGDERIGGGYMYSGMFFDIALLNVCGVNIGFERDGVDFTADAETGCLVFQFSLDSLNDLACHCGPAVASYFRNFVLSEVAWSWEFRQHSEHVMETPRTSRGFREPEEYFTGVRSRDFTDPLEDWEVHKTSVKGFLKWIVSSLAPFVPQGVRHDAMPVSGLAAKRRTMMLQKVEQELTEAPPESDKPTEQTV